MLKDGNGGGVGFEIPPTVNINITAGSGGSTEYPEIAWFHKTTLSNVSVDMSWADVIQRTFRVGLNGIGIECTLLVWIMIVWIIKCCFLEKNIRDGFLHHKEVAERDEATETSAHVSSKKLFDRVVCPF